MLIFSLCVEKLFFFSLNTIRALELSLKNGISPPLTFNMLCAVADVDLLSAGDATKETLE
jgi:hypothetical protein